MTEGRGSRMGWDGIIGEDFLAESVIKSYLEGRENTEQDKGQAVLKRAKQ